MSIDCEIVERRQQTNLLFLITLPFNPPKSAVVCAKNESDAKSAIVWAKPEYLQAVVIGSALGSVSPGFVVFL